MLVGVRAAPFVYASFSLDPFMWVWLRALGDLPATQPDRSSAAGGERGEDAQPL